MEEISKTPGLYHVAEDIFNLLDKKGVVDCRLVNSSWKKILDKPSFWLKKMHLAKMPENVHQSWKSLSLELDDRILKEEFALTLSKICEKGTGVQPLEVVTELSKEGKYSNLVNFILLFVDFNAKIDLRMRIEDKSSCKDLTPIHLAAFYGFAETVEKLAIKYDAANIKSTCGSTPLHCAARNGDLNIVKFLSLIHI